MALAVVPNCADSSHGGVQLLASTLSVQSGTADRGKLRVRSIDPVVPSR